MKKNSNKRISVVGDVSPDKPHAWSIVIRGGQQNCSCNKPQNTDYRCEKKIQIVGDIEVGGERGIVIFETSCARSLTATDYKDPQKAVKKWKRK